MRPYYEDGSVTLYHSDFREVSEWLAADVLVTDPPYGIAYDSGRPRLALAASITGDADTSLRDAALASWASKGPALVFGSWRAPLPRGARARVVWRKGAALGMGDLSIPWKQSAEDIYVLGSGWSGARDTDNVIECPPVQSMATNGRLHPHEKPVDLLCRLLLKCPAGMVADPFAGSGSTLVAAKALGRRAIGVELEERYCVVAARRLAQEVLPLHAA